MVSSAGLFLPFTSEPGLGDLLESPAGKVLDLPIGELLLSPGLLGGGVLPGLAERGDFARFVGDGDFQDDLLSLDGELLGVKDLAPSTFGEQSMDSSNGLVGLVLEFLSDCL